MEMSPEDPEVSFSSAIGVDLLRSLRGSKATDTRANGNEADNTLDSHCHRSLSTWLQFSNRVSFETESVFPSYSPHG